MARFFEGDEESFDYMFYGEQDRRMESFISDRLERASSGLQRASSEFLDRARGMYDRFYNSDAVRYARAAARVVESVWISDEVRRLTSLKALQTAKPRMQRWLMAEPTYRKLFNEGKAAGYGESYENLDPGKLGEEHYDYRRVMSGMMIDGEGDEDWVATTYDEDLYDENDRLSVDEQVDITESWHLMAHYAKLGKNDPGSRFDDEL